MKKMSCGELRDLLTSKAGARNEPAPARHLEECTACRTYADRLSAARRLLREHHGNAEPDSGFSDRVMARLPKGPTEVLGWAAVRLLPATVALAAVLAWFSFQAAARPAVSAETATTAPTDDLLAWVIDPTGDER